MSARLVFATSNAHKVSELEAILAPAWEGFEAFKLPQKQGRLILVTAINPTPAGEG